MKRLFYASAAILMLAIAYHIGASTATAQTNTSISGVSAFAGDGGFFVMTPNGDIYARRLSTGPIGMYPDLIAVGNFWSGAPTPTSQESWGQLKARYAPKSASTSQPPTDR